MSDQEVIERVWPAPIELIWKLWTTKEELESWWGPGGFSVAIEDYELRPDGAFNYTMSASSPEMLAAMQSRGRPTSHSVKATFSAVDAPNTLAWSAPFGPETLSTSVSFLQQSNAVKIVLTLTSTKEGSLGGPASGWRSSLDSFEKHLKNALYSM